MAKLVKKIIFIILCGTLKAFEKSIKDFIKHFDRSQRSVNIKIDAIFIVVNHLGASASFINVRFEIKG